MKKSTELNQTMKVDLKEGGGLFNLFWLIALNYGELDFLTE